MYLVRLIHDDGNAAEAAGDVCGEHDPGRSELPNEGQRSAGYFGCPALRFDLSGPPGKVMDSAYGLHPRERNEHAEQCCPAGFGRCDSVWLDREEW